MPRRKLNGGNDNVTADVEKMIDDQIEIELSKLRQGQTLSGSGSADPDDQQDIKEPLDIEYIISASAILLISDISMLILASFISSFSICIYSGPIFL